MTHPRMTLLSLLFAIASAPLGFSQTNWAIEGTGPSYGEFNTPPAGCFPGTPPYAVNPSPLPAPGCPGMLPFGPLNCQVGGGSAVDNDGNIFSGGPAFPAMLHTDGFTIEMTTYAGAYILSMPIPPGAILPGILKGLAYDSLSDTVWITDGTFFAGLALTPCAIPPVIAGPFPLPGAVVASGLGWDPCTGTLWFCDCTNDRVVNITTAGIFISGFSSLVFAPALSGLSVNSTNGNIVVTDGFGYAEFTPAGVLAPAGPFYLTANPAPVPLWSGAPIDGLGFSLRPQTYGRGCGSGPPTMGWAGGYPFAGNFGFTATQSAATPGLSSVFCFSVTGPACPALPFGGCPPGTGLWILPALSCFSAGTVPAAGTVSFPLPIPPSGGFCGFPVGISVFCQFINFGGGTIELSDGLAFTIGEV